ncbi:hypothetical protein F4803DRAFT_488397 [Xylaria telfairii]|nr:hypothetical protein F4803DRAFT_488397 [Xylaria telfairii]
MLSIMMWCTETPGYESRIGQETLVVQQTGIIPSPLLQGRSFTARPVPRGRALDIRSIPSRFGLFMKLMHSASFVVIHIHARCYLIFDARHLIQVITHMVSLLTAVFYAANITSLHSSEILHDICGDQACAIYQFQSQSWLHTCDDGRSFHSRTALHRAYRSQAPGASLSSFHLYRPHYEKQIAHPCSPRICYTLNMVGEPRWRLYESSNRRTPPESGHMNGTDRIHGLPAQTRRHQSDGGHQMLHLRLVT